MLSMVNPHSLVPTKAPMMEAGSQGICGEVDHGPTFGNNYQGFILRISDNASIIPSEAKGSYSYRFPSDAHKRLLENLETLNSITLHVISFWRFIPI